jgi:hypothetical protein
VSNTPSPATTQQRSENFPNAETLLISTVRHRDAVDGEGKAVTGGIALVESAWCCTLLTYDSQMKPILSIRSIAVLVIAVVGGLRANDASPQLANSPQAQRIHNLTLISGSLERPNPELLAAKVRVLVELAQALQAKIAAIDVLLRDSGISERLTNALREERETVVKREREVTRMVRQATLMQELEAATRN